MNGSAPLIREYREDDLGRVVDLWHREGLLPGGPGTLSVESATDLLGWSDAVVLVAEADAAVVGVAAGSLSGVVGSIFWVVGDESVCGRLIDELEGRLVERGARRVTATVERGGGLYERLHEHGYEEPEGVAVVDRELPATTAGPTAVSELGGRMIDPGLWDSLRGMEEAKQIIERRVILPLAEPGLAEHHGVTPPRAVVLFGPPGTGKTTFAKGVAARLDWPFVPLETSRFSGGAEQAPERLAGAFDRLLELPSAVAGLAEVEDLAAARVDARKVSEQVTTELLRQVPRLRDRPHHLLVCATNRVGSLDRAFLRPGRFDYVLPVGPPDEAAREAIWRRYVGDITTQDVDLGAVVRASERFTPADIEFAARKAAQLAFENEYFGETEHRAGTGDFLQAIDETRPTLTDDMVAEFEEDVEQFARY